MVGLIIQTILINQAFQWVRSLLPAGVTKIKTALMLATCLTLIPTATTLPAYSCDTNSVRYATIDLTGPADCPDPDADFEKPDNITIQVLETEATIAIQAYRC